MALAGRQAAAPDASFYDVLEFIDEEEAIIVRAIGPDGSLAAPMRIRMR